MIDPILSVCVRTYNQELYVAEAIESVLAQLTNFDYEIIISDDCSSDKTPDILLKYAHNNPDKIRLVLGADNIGGPNNLRRVIESSSAKYLAFLDGDDYYLDSYKLQKQVDFLENHPEFVACFHNVINRYENGKTKPNLFMSLDFPPVHNSVDVISKDWFLPIHSVMLRRELIVFPDWYDKVMNDDYVMNLSVVLHGPYYYMKDVMAVYRHHSENVSNNYSNQVLIDTQLRNILEGFREIYPSSYKKVFDDRIQFYNNRISFNQKEIKEPWRKWLRFKTYKRLFKQLILKI